MRVVPKGAVEADPWETPEPEADEAPAAVEVDAVEIEADTEVELDDIELR
jgi:hypothetical protein